jgi:vacuolar-type H+-ATPase subunit E/Vma4
VSVDALLAQLTREAEEAAHQLVAAAEQRARAIDPTTAPDAARRREHDLARLEAAARHAVA